MTVEMTTPWSGDAWRTGGDVLLVTPPFSAPAHANVAAATLKPILEAEGLTTDLLHGTLLHPWTETDENLLCNYGHFCFVPHLYPDIGISARDVADTVLRRRAADYGIKRGIRPPPLDPEAVLREVAEDLPRAGVWMARALDLVLRGSYGFVGFSCSFEGQLVPGLALARRLREECPDVAIAFGGSALYAPVAEALVEGFRFVDAACYCEGYDLITPLVRAMLDTRAVARGLRDERLSAVPGIAFVDASGRTHRTAAPPPITDMDRLPIPDYTDFVAQLGASEWASLAPILGFEGSRGCWWGEKSLCRFCGFNSAGLPYRRKSNDRVVEEISTILRRHPEAAWLQATDNILDRGFLTGVAPRLVALARRPTRPLRIWLECRSDLSARDVAALDAAGVRAVWPGIESLSDGLLRLMRKGAVALTQVQMLKYLAERDIRTTYALLVWNPGESAAHYRDMTALLPYVMHLPPPILMEMGLVLSSPYFEEPERYGIRNIRPREHYRFLYPEPGLDPSRLAFLFDYDHDMFDDEAHAEAIRSFAAGVRLWTERYEPGTLVFRDEGRRITIVDRRRGCSRVVWLYSTAAEVFRLLERHRPVSALRRSLPHLDSDVLDAFLDRLLHARWACHDARRRRFLVVVPSSRIPPGTAHAGDLAEGVECR